MADKIITCLSIDFVTQLFGTLDSNLTIIEEAFHVSISYNDDSLKVHGESSSDVENASVCIRNLQNIYNISGMIDKNSIRYIVNMVLQGDENELSSTFSNCICFTGKGKPINARTVGQKKYVEMIKKNDIVFGIGPAGTGKTFIAVAMAVQALKQKMISRIVLTRPAVEAGEKLGFLPGDLQSKIEPYLRPLYDSLYEMIGSDGTLKYTEKGILEICPLAYMRGRTIDDAFIILDEAQNTTPEQMKMFLTRLGNNSKAIITGDITQIDLPKNCSSGLVDAIKILSDIEGIGIFKFSKNDIVRHPLVQKIITAYEKYDK